MKSFSSWFFILFLEALAACQPESILTPAVVAIKSPAVSLPTVVKEVTDIEPLELAITLGDQTTNKVIILDAGGDVDMRKVEVNGAKMRQSGNGAVLAPLMALSVSFSQLIVAGLDHRYGWSPVFPTWLTVLGLLLVAFGYFIGVWAMAENQFFSGVVRIQKDRGHMVCDSGLYRIVRHPGYTGNIIPLPGIVLALSSVWTIIPAVAALIIAVTRTALEDQTLQEELPGYREYVQRVRYRLIPGIY